MDTFTFHAEYSQSYWVTRYAYPFWQPLVWFSKSFSGFFPATHTVFLVKADAVISLLALVGLPELWRWQPAYFYWLVIGFLTLLAWPTKWPQYTMIVIVPVCLSAGFGLGWTWHAVSKIIHSRRIAARTGK